MAVTLILIAMGGMMLVFTSALAQTAGAKQREVADSLLTKSMEQVRALPYTTVSKGLDTAEAAGDPNIQYVSSTVWRYIPTGEDIPHGSLGYTQQPLNPHTSKVTINSTPYTISVYPSTYTGVTGSAQPVYRVTVMVTWTGNSLPGRVAKVSGQTFVYSPSGCLSTATHPFGAPCQPFFYSTATTGLGAIQVIPADSAINGINGIDLQSAQLTVPEQQAMLDSEQISKVLAKSVTSGGLLDLNGASPSQTGAVGTAPQADTDPASSASPYASGTLTQSAGTLTQTDNSGSNANWISVTSSPGDTGSATATASASASPACQTLAAVTITNSLPCASTAGQQNGTSSITMGLYSGNTYWGSATLASMEAAPAATRLFTNKWGASGGAACTTTSGDGCLHAGATRTLGRIRLGGLPATFISGGAAPVGWDPANYLVEFTSLTDQVDAESGVSAATPTATRSGSLKYWNGSGYTTVALGAATPAPVTLPSVVVSDASGTGTLQVTMSGTITFGALSTATALPAGCTTICTARATSASPAVANITYTATNGGTTLAYLVISMDLANLEVETKYRAAPSAG